MIGSIDDLIGQRANTRHRLPVSPDRSEQSLTFFSRLRPARLGEAILKNVVGSLKEKDNDLQARSTQSLELFFEVGEKLTFADVDDERGAPDAFFFVVSGNKPAKRRQHRNRQIVDAEVS